MTRMEQLMQRLPEGIDCAWISADVNRRYFTGMASSAGNVICFRDGAYLLIDFRYIEKARACVKDCQVIELENLSVQVENLLQQHHATTIAVESAEMTLQQFSNLQKRFSHQYTWDTSNVLSDAIKECRMVKTPDEIEQIQAAQRIAEAALQNVIDWLHVGVTEREIQRKLDFTMLELGAEAMSFPTIALTGARTSMPHGVPSDAAVQAGDFVLMDFGAMVNGYHSDMTRTVCVGTPTEKMKSVYEVVRQAQAAALQAARAGITGKKKKKSIGCDCKRYHYSGWLWKTVRAFAGAWRWNGHPRISKRSTVFSCIIRTGKCGYYRARHLPAGRIWRAD